jgi:hypothetical protein
MRDVFSDLRPPQPRTPEVAPAQPRELEQFIVKGIADSVREGARDHRDLAPIAVRTRSVAGCQELALVRYSARSRNARHPRACALSLDEARTRLACLG